MSKDAQIKIRLPSDLKAFVDDQATRYGSSLNSEIVRAVRERMERIPPSNLPSGEAAKAPAP